MSYGFITHTPQQEARWKSFCRTNPARVVRCLHIGPLHPRSSDGDTQQEVYPALAAVTSYAGGSSEAAKEVWEGLVEAGVVDILCKNVLDMVTFVHTLPGMPEDLKQQAMKSVSETIYLKSISLMPTYLLQMKSPYFAPLNALTQATLKFAQPPTATDTKVISILKQNWTEMVERVRCVLLLFKCPIPFHIRFNPALGGAGEYARPWNGAHR